MIMSLRDDFQIMWIFSFQFFNNIPKGFHNCQFSIVNCQLKHCFHLSYQEEQLLAFACPLLHTLNREGGLRLEELMLPHKLTLEGRSKLTMTGVTEVVSFDENAVFLHTTLGDLLVQGEELKLKTLSVEGGQVSVEGKISAMAYEEPRRTGGWLSRLLG